MIRRIIKGRGDQDGEAALALNYSLLPLFHLAGLQHMVTKRKQATTCLLATC